MTFPQLKTGAVMQYPGSLVHRYSTNVARFLDGSEQRFRERRARRRRWLIQLELLDDAEMCRLEQFVIAVRGSASTFEFVDPFDDNTYSNCSFEEQESQMVWTSSARGGTRLLIRHDGN